MTDPQVTHFWFLPDEEIRTDLIPERNSPDPRHWKETYRVTHLPSGKSVWHQEFHVGLKNYIAARTALEKWVLGGEEPK